MALEEIESLSKTTKLLLLDSLLQEVCIESGSDGSLSLSSLGMSVCLVSHNLLYSGLKKAHSKKKLLINFCSEMCCGPLKSLARKVASCWLEACSVVIWVREKGIICFHLTKGFGCPLGPPAWSVGSDSVRLLSVIQSVWWRQKAKL